MKVAIRCCRESDEDALVELWSHCGLVRPWNDPRRDIARKLAVQRDLFLVASAGGRVIGSVMAGYEGHRGWINYLAVAPESRRSGIGRALMAEAERRLRALGCPKVNLQVRRDNAEAAAFYARIGFREDDVVSMGKRLEDEAAPVNRTERGGRSRAGDSGK